MGYNNITTIKKGGCRLKIKEYRIIKGFTQHEMANLLNISQKTYSAKETGKRKFTIEEIKEIKKILQVSYDELLD